jgi:hypothetical protein
LLREIEIRHVLQKPKQCHKSKPLIDASIVMLVLLVNITIMAMYSNGNLCKVTHMGNFILSWAWNLIATMLVWNIVVDH